MRVLCLDDDQIYLTVANGYLKSIGASYVESTSSFDKAGEIVRDQNIDLILLDLNMPGQDGLAFLRILSETGFSGAIIIASGENASIVSSSGFIGEKLGLNICSTLRKPLNLSDLKKAYECAECNKGAAQTQRPVNAEPNGELQPILYYQPQYDTKKGHVRGAEALLRGKDADGKIFGAETVLAKFANQTGRYALTAQIFEQFCGDVAELRKEGFTNDFSFNADALCLEDPNFIPMLKDNVKNHNLNTRGLTIELTESQLPADESWLLEVIARISIAGFEMSMDDFSTGASSFDLLRAGAFREVKLDSTLVKRSRNDAASAKFIANVADIAKTMNIRVVAEGIETKDDQKRLENLGISILQGYYFARPVHKSELQCAPLQHLAQMSVA